jgi:hypothetical protein
MPDERVLLEWTMLGSETEAASYGADVAVFADGRVRIGRRMAHGEPLMGQLTPNELQILRELIFGELRVLELEGEALTGAVRAAAEARKAAADSEAAELLTVAQMDAGTTLLRVPDGDRFHEIRYHDLLGDSHEYPEVESLQRLRRIELAVLELAEDLAGRER